MSNIDETKSNDIQKIPQQDWEQTPDSVKELVKKLEKPNIDFSEEIQERIAVIVTLLMDSLFFIFWLLLQWSISHYIVDKLQLNGIDKWTSIIFQIIFALSTAVAVGTYTWKDISLIIIRAKNDIDKEKNFLRQKQFNKLIENVDDSNG